MCVCVGVDWYLGGSGGGAGAGDEEGVASGAAAGAGVTVGTERLGLAISSPVKRSITL